VGTGVNWNIYRLGLDHPSSLTITTQRPEHPQRPPVFDLACSIDPYAQHNLPKNRPKSVSITFRTDFLLAAACLRGANGRCGALWLTPQKPCLIGVTNDDRAQMQKKANVRIFLLEVLP